MLAIGALSPIITILIDVVNVACIIRFEYDRARKMARKGRDVTYETGWSGQCSDGLPVCREPMSRPKLGIWVNINKCP